VEEFVFCDCGYAIDTVDSKLESVRYPRIFKRLTVESEWQI